MKTKIFSSLALAALVLTSTYVMASESGASKTREQVLAELVEAQRTGDIAAPGYYGGKKLNEVFPDRYPQKVATAGKTREQVKSELAEAQRTGDIPAISYYGGKKLNEVFPERYKAQ